MKKFLSVKTIAVFLILALSVVAFVACVKPTPEDNNEDDKTPAYAIPEFELKIKDGESEYTVTKSDVSSLSFASASRTSKGVTTYYKGFLLSDILELKNIAIEGITSVTIDDGDYDSDLEAANISSCVLATVASATEAGGYVIMTTPENNPEDPEGPIRAVSMAEETEFKSIKNAVNITINR